MQRTNETLLLISYDYCMKFVCAGTLLYAKMELILFMIISGQ